jgi:RNA polymerase sigma factor (sigma-70 family)
MDRAIETLEPRQARAIVLKYYEDYTDDEIAEALGEPVRTVQRWIRIAKNRLGELLTIWRG